MNWLKKLLKKEMTLVSNTDEQLYVSKKPVYPSKKDKNGEYRGPYRDGFDVNPINPLSPLYYLNHNDCNDIKPDNSVSNDQDYHSHDNSTYHSDSSSHDFGGSFDSGSSCDGSSFDCSCGCD